MTGIASKPLREIYCDMLQPLRCVSDGTRSAEQTALNWFEILVPEVRDLPAMLIKALHLAQWKAAWVDKTGLKPQTWNKYYRHIRCILRDLHDLDVIPKVPKCKPLREDEPVIRIASVDEIRRIYHSCRVALWPDHHSGIPASHYWQAVIVAAYTTGLRRRDILNIRVGDLDSERLTLVTRQRKTGKLRAIPVTRELVTHLERLQRSGNSRFFYSTSSNRQFYREWHRIQDHAGIEDHFGVHDLRRTCGSMVYQTSGIHAASELLAHSSLAVTRRHYLASGIVEESLREAVNRMPSPFSEN